MTPGPRYPALSAWRRELTRCERTPTELDRLWLAACWEAAALEAEAAGAEQRAQECRRRARDVLREAVSV